MATEEMKTRGSFHLLKEIVSKEHSKCNQIVTMKEAIDISKQNRTKLKHLFKEKNNRFLIESQKKNTIIIEQSVSSRLICVTTMFHLMRQFFM